MLGHPVVGAWIILASILWLNEMENVIPSNVNGQLVCSASAILWLFGVGDGGFDSTECVLGLMIIGGIGTFAAREFSSALTYDLFRMLLVAVTTASILKQLMVELSVSEIVSIIILIPVMNWNESPQLRFHGALMALGCCVGVQFSKVLIKGGVLLNGQTMEVLEAHSRWINVLTALAIGCGLWLIMFEWSDYNFNGEEE
jgi:hypothetical protein